MNYSFKILLDYLVGSSFTALGGVLVLYLTEQSFINSQQQK